MSLQPTVAWSHRFDVFEPDDKTALVCVDAPELQVTVIQQLEGLGYKIHTSAVLDDALLKLGSHTYHVVVCTEDFSGQQLYGHAVLAEAAQAAPARRRRQLYVLLGGEFITNDEMQAFNHSVDMVVAISEAATLRPILRGAVARQAEFYTPFKEAQASLTTG